MAAKQPSVEQIDQLIRDLGPTARSSAFPAVRDQAQRLLPVAERFRDELAEYRRVCP